MKRFSLTLICISAACTMAFAQAFPYQDKSLPIEDRIEDLLGRMTLEEKLSQMKHIHSNHYDNKGSADLAKMQKSLDGMSRGCMEAFPYSLQQYVDAVYAIQKEMKENTRLGIPVIPVVEGLHGVVQDGCTIYPQAIAQSATFSPELIEEMGYQIALEARSIGAWQILSPCLDIARELRWGRIEETFGEDPFMNAINGTAYVRGAQKAGAICTPKHFVAHGSPVGGVNLASVAGGKYDLYNTYLPPFRMIIDECAPLSIMNCYSVYDGEAVTGSKYMLTDLLRGELGFKGYVYSDWGSIGMLRYFHKVAQDAAQAAKMSIEAGLDLEASSTEYNTVNKMIENGEMSIEDIDNAVRNILYAKFKSGIFDAPLPDRNAWKTGIHSEESVKLAKQMAVESAVLLENGKGMLPLNASKLSSIAVIGPNASRVQFGDYSWGADTEYGVTPLEGMTAIAGDKIQINYAEGCDLWSQDRSGFKEAVKAARKSDVAVVFVGSQSALLARKSEPATSGEGFDLHSLKLPGVQEELIDALCETGTPVVVVLVTGKPFEMIRIKDKAAALVVQWYAGEEQGSAIAELLFGKENFSGRLPVSFPKSTGHLPCYYNYYPSDKGYYNRKGTLDKPGRDYVFSDPYALYTFGYGLSYSSFEYTDMTVEVADGKDSSEAGRLSMDDTIIVKVSLKNTSDIAGKETVQIYANDKASSYITPAKTLIGYKKIEVGPMSEAVAVIEIPASRLAFYDKYGKLILEPGDFEIMACSSASDVHFTQTVTVEGAKVAVKDTAASDASGSVTASTISIEIMARDIQATVVEGVKVVVDGKVVAVTSADGTCSANIPSGAKIRFTKEGYETIERTITASGRIDLTMTPSF